MIKFKKGTKLDEILKALIALDHEENYKTGGEMWLNWRPPAMLYVSRFGVPPSEQEAATVERFLRKIGYEPLTGKLRQKKKHPTAPVCYYWKISITRIKPLI